MEVNVTRRDLLKAGGLAVVGGAVAGCATATGINPAVPPAAKVLQDSSQTQATPASAGATLSKETDPRTKPTYVPQANNPVAFSLADNLFWNDILMEHSMFFQQLLPGPENDSLRNQAQEFERLFAQQLEQSRGITEGNYVTFNQRSIDLARRLSDWKKSLREQQANGKVRTLIWPLFLEHTAREADRFAARLALYNKRQIELDRSEVIDFWSKTMGEHSGFIAHLLDPDEKLLIDQASKLEKSFRSREFRNVRGDAVMKAAQEVLDFKTVGEKGIYAGKIKSIISPRLASHVRREAVRFVDELKRTEGA
jgi:hypothetical protein